MSESVQRGWEWLEETSSPLPKTIQEKFEAFHARNPSVYRRLVAMAYGLRAKGHQHIGIGMLWEVLRYENMLRTEDEHSDYKLNDHYRSRYARLIVSREPQLARLIELRSLRSE